MPARLHPVLLAGASALALCACKVDSRPLLARGEPAYAAAPAYSADSLGLPYAQPAQVMPAADIYDGYALAERAYAYDRVAYRTPPDYGFEYGDADPWAWQVTDDSLMFAEPYGDDYRFYYYEPGERYPYFVRDADYGYAYGDNGALMALFSAAGALLPNSQLDGVADIAGRYLAHGYDLRQTYYDAPRYAVAETVWIERAPRVFAIQDPWFAAADSQPVWRQYRVSTGQRELRAFEAERLRREVIARRYDDRIDWKAAKAYRKAVHEDAKAFRKATHEDAKAIRKFEKDEAKHARRFEREVRRGQARDVRDFARPVAARVEDRRVDDHRGRDDRRADDHRGRGRDDKDRGRREIARNDAPGPAADHRGRGGDRKADDQGKHGRDHGKKGGDDHGKRGGGDHGKGHGGDGKKGGKD